MNVRATAKFVGTSSRKVGMVAALIRGRRAQEALTVLGNTPKRAAGPVGKTLKSAIANAENNYRLNVHDLTIESIQVDPGPALKRFRPRAQGRAYGIRKRTSHITVVLGERAVTGKPASVAKSAPGQTAQTEPKAAKPAKTVEAAARKEAK